MINQRKNRKTVKKFKQKKSAVRTPVRYFTEEGYKSFYSRTVDQAGLRDKMVWRRLDGKKQLVVVERQLPTGVWDGFHEEAEGAQPLQLDGHAEHVYCMTILRSIHVIHPVHSIM